MGIATGCAIEKRVPDQCEFLIYELRWAHLNKIIAPVQSNFKAEIQRKAMEEISGGA
jgi:hypothetical protein